MRYYNIGEEGGDRMPVNGIRSFDRNADKMVRPFESSEYCAGLNFSHGHLIKNAGYRREYSNVFKWEEPLQTYLAFKAGYKMYALNEQVIWHLWDRSFRPRFAEDAVKFSKKKQKALNSNSTHFFDNKTENLAIRRLLWGDKDFRRYFDENWGLDLLGG